MKMYTEEIGKKLNALLEKTYDAEIGFKKAAENAKDVNLKTYFTRKSSERNQFGHELKSEILQYGQQLERGGSTAGAIHRKWMDVKAFFSIDNDESMLEAAITGENAAVKEYEQTLQEVNLPPTTAALLAQQMERIKNDLTTIKTLEDIS